MCGIAGAIGSGEHATASIDAQLALLRHRGPDSHGAFGKDGGVIGQTRLAVIDLTTGDPPITNEDGSIGAVLNGEIYNFRELRDDLAAGGHVLRTRGDTEVIAHLGETEPPAEIARRLQGMFAFAVWDERRRRLVLGRDRLGKKPLYYFAGADTFVFGSELKAVLAHPAVSRELEPRAIPAYLTFGYVPSPLTFYRGVLSVPPGHVLVLEDGSSEPRLIPYWQPPLPGGGGPDRLDVPLERAGRLVREALERAVERRLVADVPLGAFLSGGIDSSAIVAIMARTAGAPVQTFTIGFDDNDGFDERRYARVVAQRYGTDHHEFVVSPDAVELVEQLLWHHDQPFGDSSAVPTFLLCEQTRRHVTVALSGDGGDELFAGYERFAAALAVARMAAVPPGFHRALSRGLARAPRAALRGRVTSLRRFSESAALGLPGAYREWLAFFGEERRGTLLTEADGWGLRDYDEVWRSSERADPLDRLLNLNLRTYLLDDLLVKADRMSMAHGLEVRSPFLDIELLELALRIPARQQVRGFARKRVLKAAVSDLLPPQITDRRKRGFGVPLDRWFRDDLAAFVRDRVGAPDARVKRHLAPDAVDRCLHEHATGATDHGQALWALLTLELFLRREDW